MRTDTQKIVGIVQCKNEWALIAVSVSYALENHVDEVYVLNDASSDQTAEGLKHLQRIWGARLHVISTKDIGFRQEAMANTAAHIAHSVGAEWIYVFDADEFLLIDKGHSLRSLIEEHGHNIVKYRVENFVSFEDFDESELASYRRLRYKACAKPTYDSATMTEIIRRGDGTFFDVPFPTKLIYRYSKLLRLRAGAHRLISYDGDVAAVTESRIRAVHLPLLTRKRLINKARTGESYMKGGYDPRFGWQNRLIYRLEAEGRLDWFWSRHSIRADGVANAVTPRIVIDEQFVECVETTLQALQAGFASSKLSQIGSAPIECGVADETMIPIHQAFTLAATLQKQADGTRPTKRRRSFFGAIKDACLRRG